MVFVDVVLSKICIIEKSFGFVLLKFVAGLVAGLVVHFYLCTHTARSHTLHFTHSVLHNGGNLSDLALPLRQVVGCLVKVNK